MAPEQLEGGEVDARADIFAFGAVLYEMTSGRRAFAGKSAASIIGAVLRDEPPPLAEVQPLAPRALDRVVRTCLAKDPAHRFHSAHDVGLELGWVAEEAASRAAPSQQSGASGRTYLLAALTIAAAVAIGALAGRALNSSSRDVMTPVRFEIQPPADQVLYEPVISPDGRHIAVVVTDNASRTQLWLRPLESETLRRLDGTEDATYPVWSPDSRFIAFFADRKLKRVALSGGPPIVICEAENARGGTWNRDGVILFAPTLISPLASMSASGGEPAPVTDLEAPATGHRWPHFLPDGDHFVYLAFAGQDTSKSTLRVGSLTRPGSSPIVEGATEARYADGFLFFVQGDVLVAQSFDPGRRTLHEDRRPVARTPALLHTGRYAFSVAGDGTLVYRLPGEALQRSQLTWLAHDGRPLGTIGEVDAYVTPRISPDQSRVAVGRSEGRSADIWILETPGRTLTRLTTSPSRDSTPVWSPDSSKLAVAVDLGHGGGVELQIVPTDTTGAPSSLHASTFTLRPSGWSADGRILFQRIDRRDLVNILTIPLEARSKPLPFKADAFNYIQAALSPDGRHVAYASDLSGRFEVYVEDFPTPGNRRPVSNGGGSQRVDESVFAHFSSSESIQARLGIPGNWRTPGTSGCGAGVRRPPPACGQARPRTFANHQRSPTNRNRQSRKNSGGLPSTAWPANWRIQPATNISSGIHQRPGTATATTNSGIDSAISGMPRV